MTAVTHPADLIRVVPYLLGFHPENSLVLVWLRERCIALTARLDRHAIDEPDAFRAHLGHIQKQADADACVVLAFADDPECAITMVLAATQALEVDVVDACITNSHVWASLMSDERGELDDEVSPALAELVATGRAPWPSREQMAQQLRSSDQVPEDVIAGQWGWFLEAVGEGVTAMSKTLEEVGDDGQTDQATAVRLALLLRAPLARDEVWRRLSPVTAEWFVALWRGVIAQVPTSIAAGPVCALGLASWQRGDGGMLSVCLERVEEIDPEFGTVGVLRDVVNHVVRPSVWTEMMPPAPAGLYSPV